MCCGDKCLFFIPVRIGSLIFGYIIAIVSALGTLCCTFAIIYFLSILMFGGPGINISEYYWNRNNDERININTRKIQEIQTMYTSTNAIIITTAYLVEFASSFVCAVLMLVGVTQGKPKLIIPYLIYGMIQSVLLLVFFIIFSVTSKVGLAPILAAIPILGIYSSCLYMVFRQYQMMTMDLRLVNPPASNPGVVYSFNQTTPGNM